LSVFKRFLVSNFGEQGALEAMPILKNLLDQEINETEVSVQIGQHLNYSSKLELLHLLFDIAYADGEVVDSELATIVRIANIFRIDRLDFESIKAPYMESKDHNWSYKSLEIEPSATDDEIKKAYRKLSKQFHPDVNPEGAERFKEIAEAYDTLSNPDKKQKYDNPMSNMFGGGGGPGGMGFEDFLNQMGFNRNPFNGQQRSVFDLQLQQWRTQCFKACEQGIHPLRCKPICPLFGYRRLSKADGHRIASSNRCSPWASWDRRSRQ
jgi:hypothetical protein